MGALALVDGKAKLVDKHHCDGLGVCIGQCPFDAIQFDVETVEPFAVANPPACSGECPSHENRVFDQEKKIAPAPNASEESQSALNAWPIQLHLIRPDAPQFCGRDVLIAASCSAFSTGGFHSTLLPGKALIIACPKLDDQSGYREKLTELFRDAVPTSVTIARMSVPCCQGLNRLVLEARDAAQSSVPVKEVVIGLEGELFDELELGQPTPASSPLTTL